MKKVLFSILTILIFIIAFTGVSNASDFTITVDSDLTTIRPGDTVVFKFSVADIDVENGIEALEGKLEYDREVFEQILDTNVKAVNGWENLEYNGLVQSTDDGFFTIVAPEGETITTNSEFIEITVKIKDTAKIGNTTVKITDVVAKSDEEEIPIPNIVFAVKISESTSGNTNNTTNSINTTNNTTNITNNNTSSDIPKTGIEDYFMPAIIMVSVVGIIALIRYKKIGQI